MLDFIKSHILSAGEMCRRQQNAITADDVEFKGPKDLVTRVDREVENYLVEAIRKNFPGHDIIGEEGGDQLTGAEYCWLIDPIDGTTSYFHKQPYFSVSIGVRRGDQMVAAGIFAPALGQLFLAAQGQGACLNDQPIRVSSCRELQSAVLGTGFACVRKGCQPNNLPYLNRLLPKIRDVRRCGSAAIDLAYVAAGKYDGFWEMQLNDYDIAAGLLLVKEAGGAVCDIMGGPDFPQNGLVATNGLLTDKLLAELRAAELA